MADQTVSLKLEGDAESLKAAVNQSGDAMEDLAGRSTAAGESVEASVSGASSAWEDHSETIRNAGAAIGGFGLAIEGLARSQQDTRAVAGRLANALEGETTDSVMGLAAEIHNATTDLDNLVASMEIGSQQGIDSGAALQDYALFWDMVGDATGESDVALAGASSSLRAVGIAAGQEKDALGAFGYIAQETTGSVGEFLGFLERTGPELRDMGANVDDAAAILGILEQEFGMTGKVARTEFRKAVGEADGSMSVLLDTLGISETQFAATREEVAASSEVISNNAEAYAESRTKLQEFSAGVESFLAEHSGMVESMSAVSPILMGAGGTVFAIGQVIEAKRKWAGSLSGLAGKLGPGLGLAGVALAATWAISELGTAINNAIRGAPADVRDLSLAIEGLAATGEIPEAVAGSMDTLADSVARIADPGWADAGQAHLPSWLQAPEWKKAEAEVEAFDKALAQAAQSGNDAALSQGLELLNEMAGQLGIPLDELVRTHFPEYARAAAAAGVASEEAGGDVEGLEGSFEDLEVQIEDTRTAHQRYIDDLRAAEDPVFRLDRALQSVEDAQQKYNDAVEEHGPRSREAQEASMELLGALSEVEQAAIDGDLSFAEFDRRLETWVDQGHITATQADAVRDRVHDLRGAAEDYSGNYHATLTADLTSANGNLDAFITRLQANGFTRGDAVWSARLSAQAQSITPAVKVVDPSRTVERRASGGPVWPDEPFLVGEEGPELVTFSQPGYVHDAASTAQMATHTGSQFSVQQTFHGDVSRTTLAEARHQQRLAYLESR
jgi:hypothetical protein